MTNAYSPGPDDWDLDDSILDSPDLDGWSAPSDGLGSRFSAPLVDEGPDDDLVDTSTTCP